MQANRNIILYLLLALGLKACVEPYEPRINEQRISMVIDGRLTDREGYHSVRLSRSSDYNMPEFIPETGASVEVVSGTGESVTLFESEPGLYEQFFPQSFLRMNEIYHVNILTREGTRYRSRPDSLLPCAPVEEVYYEEEVKGTSDPLFPVNGVRIYTDLDIPDGFARNYRWELEETWEYHSPYLIQMYYIGYIVDLGSVTDSLQKCWVSGRIHEIYTQSAEKISGSRINRIPLNYVSDESNRLKIKYSLQVKQYSLSQSAFLYWDRLKKQSQESGGLYEQQPAKLTGNVYNPSNPDERVLGNFNVSAVSMKRIYIEQNFKFRIWDYECRLIEIGPANPLGFYSPSDYPVYLTRPEVPGPLYTANEVCFDCRKGGGRIEPPDWWE